MGKSTVEDRRRQIMEAAIPLFAEKGFKGTTNRDIAQAAHIAPGLIYWYFKNKEDLLSAILDEYLPADMLTLPLAYIRDLPPAQVLPMIGTGFLHIVRESRLLEIGRIIMSETLRTPGEGKRLSTIFRRILAPLIDYLTVQIERGTLRQEDPALMANMFFSSLAFFFIRKTIGLDEQLEAYPEEQVLAFVTVNFLRAFSV